jgi:hypothetical protein
MGEIWGQTDNHREGCMEAYGAESKFARRNSAYPKSMGQFYSVEFSPRGISVPYQFKIWDVSPPFMYVLVKEYSAILSRLKVGDILNMKYYSTDSVYRPECRKTAIRHIIRNDQGRFKGHYLVGLEILKTQDGKMIH